MADPKSGQVASVMNDIPFGNLIGGPLSACILAQADAAQTALDYIQQVSMQPSDLGDDSFEPVTVSFTFQNDGQKRVLVVPLLTIIPVPFIGIDHMDISFTADVKNSEGTTLKGHFTAPAREVEQEEESQFEVENLIEVKVHAVTSEMPSGLAKLLDVFNSQLFVVESVDGEELVRLKQAQKEKRILNEKKKKAREAYLAAVEAGDPAAIRKARNTVVSTLARGEAKVFLRDKNVPEPTAPFLIRVTRTLKDNPDCEFDKSKPILANIRALESLQRVENNVLRSHLIHALWLARKMYPNDSSTVAGRVILSAAEARVKSRPNGWYTFGGPDAAAALRAFVDYLVANEKALLASVSRPVTSGAGASSASTSSGANVTSTKEKKTSTKTSAKTSAKSTAKSAKKKAK